MKKLMMIIAVVMFSASIHSASIAGGCTICTTSSDECHRIILKSGDNNEVHIYHGDASPCPQQ